jgi:hypothetical protein
MLFPYSAPLPYPLYKSVLEGDGRIHPEAASQALRSRGDLEKVQYTVVTVARRNTVASRIRTPADHPLKAYVFEILYLSCVDPLFVDLPLLK